MKKIFILTGIFLTILLTIWGCVIEPNKLSVKQVEINISKITRNNNIKIAIISDLHIGLGYMNLKKIKKIVNSVNKEKPDIIVNLGDYHAHTIGLSNIKFADISKELSQLKAKYGVYSILGNHDGLIVQHKWLDGRYKTLDFQKNMVIDIIKDANIKLLNDSYEIININGSKFALVGLTDYYSTTKNYIKLSLRNKLFKANYKNIAKVFSEIPEDLPVIILNHSPDIFPEVPNNVFLTLAGHIHKSHINLPLINKLLPPSIYSNRYLYGLYKENNKYLYVTSGSGGFPLRINAEPEIVIMKVKFSE